MVWTMRFGLCSVERVSDVLKAYRDAGLFDGAVETRGSGRCKCRLRSEGALRSTREQWAKST